MQENHSTAGHCTLPFSQLGITKIWVTFDSDLDPQKSKLISAASFATHPGFDPNTLFNDVGVVILSKPVRGVTPGLLPPENLLDQMQAAGTLQGQTFVNHSSTHRSRFCAITTGARFAGSCATDDHFTNTSGNFASGEKKKTARKV